MPVRNEAPHRTSTLECSWDIRTSRSIGPPARQPIYNTKPPLQGFHLHPTERLGPPYTSPNFHPSRPLTSPHAQERWSAHSPGFCPADDEPRGGPRRAAGRRPPHRPARPHARPRPDSERPSSSRWRDPGRGRRAHIRVSCSAGCAQRAIPLDLDAAGDWRRDHDAGPGPASPPADSERPAGPARLLSRRRLRRASAHLAPARPVSADIGSARSGGCGEPPPS